MSEEILRALMELFAIIIKQDGGLSGQEETYVHRFLIQQIGEESSKPYFKLFLSIATDAKKDKKKLTSVLDSVKTLKIGKKINKTLNQQQKIVVIVRCLELINTEYQLTDQRLNIVKTMAEFFKISNEEFASIIDFVTASENIRIKNDNILIVGKERSDSKGNKHIHAEGLDSELYILRIPSVELYFLNYSGKQELLLNGHPLNANVIYLLANGSSIRMPVGLPIYYSDIAAKFHSDRDEEKIMLQANELHYLFPGDVVGLDHISFSAEQGNLIGIMGASGSGKTTLLNVLSGMYKPSSGEVIINNIKLDEKEEKLNGVIGYVPQDDLLIEELTVYENLWFNAKFCFNNLSKKEIHSKVMEILDSLGLNEKKDLTVGSAMNKTISGGQRKRLNIALELIREPSILYLDEPTSGLSSRDSENVLDLLRELTIKGKLIFIVIHQPSSELYKMFDQVIILDEGGKMVYYGNPVEAVIHFKKIDHQVNSGIGECPTCGNVNPEQIFNIIEARQVDEFGNYTAKRKISPRKWKEFYSVNAEENELQIDQNPPPSNLNIPNWFGQCFNYLKRDFKSKISNTQYLTLVLTVSPLLAIILSYIIRYIADPNSHIYHFRENENIPIYIFMAIIVALFLGLIMSAEEIFRDRKILKREQFLHLSRSSYLVAKIMNVMLMSAVQTIIFVLIANSVLGIKEMTFFYWFALFSVAVCANLIGLIISSAFNSAVSIYIIIPLVMIPMMVLSGAMFSFEKLNRSITSVNKVPLIADMMPTKWAYEGLMVHQYKANKFQANFFEMEREISRTNFKSAYYIPELEERLSKINTILQEENKLVPKHTALEVLKNEILREQDTLGGGIFTETDFLPENITNEFSSKVSLFLSDLNNYYLKRFMIANRIKQQYLNKIMSEKKDLYYEWLDGYHNESVSDNVKKIYEKNKIIESDYRLYQQTDPIYLYPEQNRSHFYAPVKFIFGRYVDTFWYNMAFIWGISIFLYIMLYYNILGKLVNAHIFKKKIRHLMRA